MDYWAIDVYFVSFSDMTTAFFGAMNSAMQTSAPPVMDVSLNGMMLLLLNEGMRLNPYLDTNGNPTIGVGHLILPSETEKFANGITRTQAVALFREDLKSYVADVNRIVKAKLTQNQFDALVSFFFNLGATKASGSTLVKNLNAGQAVVKANFTDWKSGGPGIPARREREWAVFNGFSYVPRWWWP